MSAPDLSLNNLFNVKGKVALVTGGGTGIGKMIAAALVQNGAKVYIASRKLSVVQEAAAELTAMGPGTCIALQADLGSKAQSVALAEQLKQKESKLHILVNNAGMAWGSNLDDFDEKNGWDRLMALNVKSVFYMTSVLLPLLEAGSAGNQDPARVINISSVAGSACSAEDGLSAPGNGTWSYATSKAAVNHLTRTLALPLARRTIVVNAIAPGVFPSRMTKFGIDHGLSIMEKSQPLGRIGTTEDMAGLALFLCSRASAHITGAVIPIDGGATLNVTGLSKL
ncbi:hypothetical protein PhCBS80983_g04777 [Powellomyces hirtus]|uniref:Rhamnolipids biosynthesis 3-oxoacyl-[acyl-carrier-protein] reductase n=1 Tax=Powellomyces hirtus TaxID=109895 RepID=A0A507DWG1_9FUNG|nr:hypothetical protein DFJ77DRAFT_479472 [Powellomyces hirtus]TPX56119.1 hypothetical protein PhCBS80983_g04777 [Powellomyces hirtus]